MNTRTVLVQARPSPALQEGHQRACAHVTQNRRGDRVWIGTTGKYYCGCEQTYFAIRCECCGTCGPTDGCNCDACMQLDVSTRRLPPGQLVNSEGRLSQRSSNGHFYCGRLFRQSLPVESEYEWDLKCSSEGWGASQCASCKALDSHRYESVHSDCTIAAGSPEDTDMGSTPIVPQPGTLSQIFVSAHSTLSSTPDMPLRLLSPLPLPPPPVPSVSQPTFVPIPSVPSMGATSALRTRTPPPPSRPPPPLPPSVSSSRT